MRRFPFVPSFLVYLSLSLSLSLSLFPLFPRFVSAAHSSIPVRRSLCRGPNLQLSRNHFFLAFPLPLPRLSLSLSLSPFIFLQRKLVGWIGPWSIFSLPLPPPLWCRQRPR